MRIRTATERDLPKILIIYENARTYMREHGNPTQWGDDHPKASLVRDDIAGGISYVCEEGERIVGVFAFIIGPDPTYQVIQNGAWHSSEEYGTIHRIASDGRTKGVAKASFDFCRQQIPYLRIDTHADNRPMQAAVKKYGFVECGIIYVADGSPRIAFDYMESSEEHG